MKKYKQRYFRSNSYAYDIYSDPVIRPRIGKEFQAEIPPLMPRSEYSYKFIGVVETNLVEVDDGKEIDAVQLELDNNDRVDASSTTDNRPGNHSDTMRKSQRAPKPTIKALEAIAEKCDEEKRNNLKHKG